MQTVHGSHHRGRVTEQDYKQNLKKRRSQIYLIDLPEEDYVVTIDGQYRCTVCPHLPPFVDGRALASHIRGKKHQGRKLNKLQAKEAREMPLPSIGPKSVPSTSNEISSLKASSTPSASIAMPSLLHRTNEITKRVLASNCQTQPNSKPPPPKPFMFVPPELSPSGEPLWRKRMLEQKEEEKMYQKGYRKNEKGEWYRDETVEFDSDEE